MIKIVMKHCLFCGKVLILKKGGEKRKYCDNTCKSKVIDYKNYHLKYKTNPEYKKRQKKWMREWYLKNKRKHNYNIKIIRSHPYS